eukprot:2814640-Amphidinium_carterae.1
MLASWLPCHDIPTNRQSFCFGELGPKCSNKKPKARDCQRPTTEPFLQGDADCLEGLSADCSKCAPSSR